ncbi:FtsX-like permease family protein [Escherichia coli]|uniref:FtsX-like permease family protein n=1 Tax=Escherichia coli TaxID=562 RepID=UPI000E1E28B6|nr:ABC transporter permease [Escherichia coli]RDP83849.1 FtsX-like permease family protein [Escherichia coli]
MYLYEASQNIIENKRSISSFLIFLVISFCGIAVTDSLIYSTSKKAEQELNLNGHNVITVDFESKVPEKKINILFQNANYKIVKTKRMFFSVGESPYRDDVKMVSGTELAALNIRRIKLNHSFDNNVILYSSDQKHGKSSQIFLNGIPFKVTGKIEKKKTEFLDSLGLSTFNENINYIIPLETMFRLTLDDSIDSIAIIKNTNITNGDLELIKLMLLDGDIKRFSIRSPLDAKMAVDRVLDRFSILTNSIYILLTIMMIIIIIMICRKTFQSRSTEFALKIIHGINKKAITQTVIIELVIVTFIGLVFAVIVTIIMTYLLSILIGISLLFRPVMILLSFILVIIAAYFSGLHVGNSFFKQNPVDLVKNRCI